MRKIQIYPERIYYHTGETVSGFVEVICDKDFDFSEMYVELVCREHTYFTEGTGDDETSYSESYYHHSERISIMEPGRCQEREFRVPFEFAIPEHLPTSYEGVSGWIEYTLEAKIGIRWKLDSRHQVKLSVTGKPELPSTQSVQQSLLDDETVLLDVEIENPELYLGESIQINYRVDDIIDIRGVRFDLKARELAVAQGNDDTSEKTMTSVFVGERELPRRSQNRIEIPTDVSMLATYRGPLITLTILLKIVLDIPWRLDKDLQIEIKTHRRRESFQEQHSKDEDIW